MIRVVLAGAAGRMGRMVVEALAGRADMRLTAALERPGHAALGSTVVPGVDVTSDVGAALALADVVIDFSAPEAAAGLARVAGERAIPLVTGTTGLLPEAWATMKEAARRAPVLSSPNFSVGVNLLLALVEQAARVLGPEFDLEVVETHHRQKRDAPSGTALAIGEALARGRGLRFAEARRTAREGDVGPRPADEIGVTAVRGGDVVGEHTVHFLGPAERIEVTHRAGSRAIFARGAVRAAGWIVGKPAGLYSMRDVLAG